MSATILEPTAVQHDATCGQCFFYQGFNGLPKGYCFGLPPVPFPSGGLGEREVKATRRACSVFKALPEGAAPAVKSKVDPETPGDAIKVARNQNQKRR